MDKPQLMRRTRAFALGIIRLVETLPRTRSAAVIAKQLLRAGTAVAANYRGACRGRSRRDFIAKMGIVEEEADESLFWLELLLELGLVKKDRLLELAAEANELLAITVASIRTARGGRPPIPQSALRNPQC